MSEDSRSGPLLHLEHVVTGYGALEVVHGVSLDVYPGEIVFVVGPNGAGKSTLLKAICGELPVTSGAIYWNGKETTRWNPHRAAVHGIVHVPEGRGMFAHLSVQDNMKVAAMLGSRRSKDVDWRLDLERFPELDGRLDQIAGSLSGGQQQMLALARALAAKPELLVVDEPTMGLAPIMVRRIVDILNGLKEEGMTVLLVEQNTQTALQVGTRGVILERGQLVFEGRAEELRNSESMMNAYFGIE